ncbi:hypothetical protein [Actinacidiphila soli]|uniref:hypothetical protein n=1 Tax=Actinacidiphila soli TaxID=2487275 RepID=UPI000FCA9026|nr:hypothetical protein [Actinacidiphila soli]
MGARQAWSCARVSVAGAGLAAGDATIDDFRHPDGVQDAFQNEFLIHLRAGEPCVRCGSTMVKMIAAGRGPTSARPASRARARRRPQPVAAAR